MSDGYWDRIRQNKNVHRDWSAARPFKEKLLVLERLRERTEAMRGTRYPLAARHADVTSNVHPVSTPSQQSGTGTIQIGFFGASATLTSAAVRTESSSRATTTPIGRTK